MGSWENEVLQFWLNYLLSSEEWNSKQMAGAYPGFFQRYAQLTKCPCNTYIPD